MKHHFATIAILLCAIGCYALGSTTGFTLMLALGVFLEGFVWMRLLRRSKPRHS